MDPVDPSLEDAIATPLGPLEQQIHRAVWMRGPATVREVLQDRSIWQTYSTVLTTMDRLFRKGLLGRISEGKAFRYWVRCSPEELQRRTAVSGLRQLLRTEHAALHLSYFVEAVGEQDEKLLDELQALVERHRAELLLKKSDT
ncbi:MAG: BlaI/MecI/CopY family transcriptional regulator [Candidatus Korobacteraceae bacterium]